MTVKQQAVLGRPGEVVRRKMGQNLTGRLKGARAVKIVEDVIASARSAPELTCMPPLTVPGTGGPGVTNTFQDCGAHKRGKCCDSKLDTHNYGISLGKLS
eukprot:8697763-Pyramimonas_sp.AAC.1